MSDLAKKKRGRPAKPKPFDKQPAPYYAKAKPNAAEFFPKICDDQHADGFADAFAEEHRRAPKDGSERGSPEWYAARIKQALDYPDPAKAAIAAASIYGEIRAIDDNRADLERGKKVKAAASQGGHAAPHKRAMTEDQEKALVEAFKRYKDNKKNQLDESKLFISNWIKAKANKKEYGGASEATIRRVLDKRGII